MFEVLMCVLLKRGRNVFILKPLYMISFVAVKARYCILTRLSVVYVF